MLIARRHIPFFLVRFAWRVQAFSFLNNRRSEFETCLREPGYSNDWFESQRPRWAALFERFGFVGRAKLRYLEVGVFEGQSLIWMLKNVLTDSTSRAVAVDPMFPGWGARFAMNLKASKESRKVTLRHDYSQLVLPTLKKDNFDIIYLDGGHSVQDVIRDLVLSWPLLKVGGLLIVDDCDLGAGKLPIDTTPRVAVETFIVGYGAELEVIENSGQAILRKIPLKMRDGLILTEIGNAQYNWYEKSIHYPDGKKRMVGLDAPEFDKYISFVKLSYQLEPKNPMLKDPKFRSIMSKYQLLTGSEDETASVALSSTLPDEQASLVK